MKNIFQSLALYNRSVNASLMELLKGLTKEQMIMETKAFFHSVFETFMHSVTTDCIWLRRFEKHQPELKCLQGNALLAADDRTIRKEIDDDYRKVFDIRKELDGLIESFMHEMNDQDFIRAMQYRNYKGEEVNRLVWQLLLHWFNHQTHHRGNISVLLDFMGVANDFSSLIPRI
ncbi:MAG: hypothetical protein A2176_14915 [Spirochaetes bacterium RBG_13_51_14]|nr:MAG: hypothetical protein A2176_14915 [Spirochaetes bacterium RBG_13_51_14]